MKIERVETRAASALDLRPDLARGSAAVARESKPQ